MSLLAEIQSCFEPLFALFPDLSGVAEAGLFKWGALNSSEPLVLLLLALGLEALLGGYGLFTGRGWHPRQWIVRLIRALDRQFNRGQATGKSKAGVSQVGQAVQGSLMLLIVGLVALGFALFLELLLRQAPYVWMLEILILTLFLSLRGLQMRLSRIRKALGAGSPITAREELFPLISDVMRHRDLQNLSEPSVTTGVMGGIATGFVTGLVTPVFWYCLLGLPGLFVQQAVAQVARFYRQRHLQAPMEKGFDWLARQLDRLFQFFPEAIAAFVFIAAACLTPSANPAGALARAWQGGNVAVGAVGGAMKLEGLPASRSEALTLLGRLALLLTFAGIFLVTILALLLLYSFSFS
ncbi:cobalamin biosynthesis protein [Kiloniella sp. b19]|uniref:cobalamin biosynthesis protein n=1 Tax=Kiloniella sp. GXU_MW_B19 TaxID=3141326 RepID=UPI0031CEBDC9